MFCVLTIGLIKEAEAKLEAYKKEQLERQLKQQERQIHIINNPCGIENDQHRCRSHIKSFLNS